MAVADPNMATRSFVRELLDRMRRADLPAADIETVAAMFDGILRNNPKRIESYFSSIEPEVLARLGPDEIGSVIADNIIEIASRAAEYEDRAQLYPSDFVLAVRYYRGKRYPWGYPSDEPQFGEE
jgi:hypothetical protein